ncbi:MAG: exo-alpha-sialidase [Planctomyces sp.]
MSIPRQRISLIGFASCLLLVADTVAADEQADAAARQNSSAIQVTQYAPAYPILVRNEHGPLIRLSVSVPPSAEENAKRDSGKALRLTGVTVDLSATDQVTDLQALELFSTQDNEEFSAASKIGEAVPQTAIVTIPCELELKPGRNIIWLSGKLVANASIDHHVSAICNEVQTSSEKITVEAATGRPVHRIGVAMRRHQDDGVHTYRIPALTTTSKGTLLSVYDMRRRMGRDLQEDIDIGLSRSTDQGQTWEPVRVIMDMGEYGGFPQELNGCSDPGIISDRQTGEIFCFALWLTGKGGKHQWVDDGSEPGFEIGKTAQLMMVRSVDDGVTWSKPENLTTILKKESWWLFAPSPQSGIQLHDGTLVMPVQGRTGREGTATFATIMISRDHGKTWKVGQPAYAGGNECQAAVLSDGSIMLNIRNDHERFRAVAVTNDLGETWTDHSTSRNTLIEPNCNGSLLRFDQKLKPGSAEASGLTRPLLLFANPHTQKGRTHHTIQVSTDDGRTWPDAHHLLLDEGRGAGYPSMTQIDDQQVGIVYEGSQAHLVFQRFRIDDLAPVPR